METELYHTQDTFGTGELKTNDITQHALVQVPPKTKVNVAPLTKGVKWLGHQYSLVPTVAMTMDLLQPIAEKGKAQFKFWGKTLDQWAAGYLYDQMYMKIRHRALFGHLKENDVDSLERKIRPHFLQSLNVAGLRTKLNQLTPKYGGLGKISWYDKVMSERVNLINIWATSNTIYGIGLRENMRRLQIKSGSEVPVCENAQMINLRKHKTWLSYTSKWMMENKIQIKNSNYNITPTSETISMIIPITASQSARGEETIQQIIKEYREECKIGREHKPEDGWNGRVIAVSDGSDRRIRGTGGFIAESESRRWSGSLKVPIPQNGKLSSYRAEGGGLLLMLLTLYQFVEIKSLHAWCDNESLVEKYNAMDLSIMPDPKGASLDVMDMLRWCKKLWGKRLVLSWHKGHPEERDKSGKTWSKIDWLNYAADAIAEDEYDKPNGLDLQELMLRSRQVTIQVHGSRLVDIQNDTLRNIIAEKPLHEMCKLYNRNITDINWRMTEVAAGNVKPMQRRVTGLNYQWEIKNTCGRRAELGLIEGTERIGRYAGDSFEERANKCINARCRFCFRSQVETMDHILTSCTHDRYCELRKQWYKNETEIIQENYKEFLQKFKESIWITQRGQLISKVKNCKVQDTMKAFIPAKWSEPYGPQNEPVPDEYLQGYGNRLRTFWEKMWEERMKAYEEWLDETPEDGFR